MKKLITILLVVFAFQNANSQTDIYLNITHLLGSAPLTTTHVASNNLGNNFTLDRLEYYIGEIVLTHGSGQTTVLNNTWVLVDATQSTNVLLGNFNITGLTSISFGIGVDTSVNHADPSLWTTNHPLAPRSPSMHWGWAAGYRFVAVEGRTGTSMNNIFQIHALGDNNYFKQTVNTTGSLVGNTLTINLNADYSQALKNITVNGNLFNHGEFNEAATLLSNFNSTVFFQGTTDLNENSLREFSLTPNPSNGEFTFQFDKNVEELRIQIFSIEGKLVFDKRIGNSNKALLHLKKSGIYSAKLFDGSELIGVERLIIE